MVRSPILPVEFYQSTCAQSLGDNDVRELLRDKRIFLAIAAASASLMHALVTPSRSEKKNRRAKRKLRRYLVRMSTRPTPFGAFAGVALAPLGQSTTLRIDEGRTQRSKRLDIPWLLQFVHELEDEPEIFKQLNLWANPSVLVRSGRAYIRELTPINQNGDLPTQVSVRASPLFLRLLGAAQKPIAYHELSAILLASAAQATPEKISAFLTALWQQGFLLTDLRPPFTQGHPARHVLDRLTKIVGAESRVLRLARAVEQNGEPANSLTHIHSVLAVSGELNAAVALEAARAAELLLSVTNSPAGPSHVEKYRRSFVDRYGAEREVPLLELIDPEFGIGLPAGHDGKRATVEEGLTAKGRRRAEKLFEIARCANETKTLEVELDADTLALLRLWDGDAGSAPPSLEINVFVTAASALDLDEGRFSVVVGPNVGAMEAGQSLGRFAESLGDAGINAFRQAARFHSAAQPDKCCVELSYLPRNPELTNILARPSPNRFEIDVAVGCGVAPGESIALNELRVGIRAGRFYVRCPRFDRDLSICSGHMANPQFAPSICRLLIELSRDGYAMMTSFNWGLPAIFDFLPRVRVGRIVLSVAKWRIDRGTVKRCFRLYTETSFAQSLAQWQKEWNVPRYVYLSVGDNRLVMDLQNLEDLEELATEVRRLLPDESISLEEVYPSLDDVWLRGTSGRFVCEFVVPLAREAVAEPSEPAVRRLYTSGEISSSVNLMRVKPPGSDWLYLKLYAAPSVHDDLVGTAILDFARRTIDTGHADRWFFVRYADPEPHLRLRFHGSPDVLSGTLLAQLLRWAKALVDEDLCLHFAVDTYEREVERYGGNESISYAEELFYADSESAAEVLRLVKVDGDVSRVELAVIGLDALLEGLGCSRVRRRELLGQVAAPREQSGPAYRLRKDALVQALGADVSPSIYESTAQVVRRELEKHAPRVAAVAHRFAELQAQGSLMVPLDAIYRSFAHMHCNRLGLDVKTERLAYGLLVRSYDALRALSKRGPAR
jgi:thiopeptide-type bacteriocin biosynthesis protein